MTEVQVAIRLRRESSDYAGHATRGQVGIYDASNTEESRRAYLYKRLLEQHIQVLFVEAICDKEEIIQANILELKASSPDYRGMDLHEIQQDFRKRIDGYLQQASSHAPFEGVIVEGEKKDLLGAPVKKGDRILRIAKVEGLYVTLMVSEKEMRHIAPNAHGELALLSQPAAAGRRPGNGHRTWGWVSSTPCSSPTQFKRPRPRVA